MSVGCLACICAACKKVCCKNEQQELLAEAEERRKARNAADTELTVLDRQ